MRSSGAGIVEIPDERSELKVVSEAADYGQLRTQLRSTRTSTCS